MNIAQLLLSSTNQAIPEKLSAKDGIPSFEQLLVKIFSKEQTHGLPKQLDDQELTDFMHMLNGNLPLLKQGNSASNVDQLLVESNVDHVNDQIQGQKLTQLPEHIQSQWIALTEEFHEIYTSLIERDRLPEAASRLIDLLARWTQLNSVITKEYPSMIEQPMEIETMKGQTLWKNLIKAYERRHSFNHIGPYDNEAKVDQKLVIKWLQHGLQDQSTDQTPRNLNDPPVQINRTIPMSQVEQLVIYNRQGDQAHSVEQQLIDKFNQAIRTSRFLSMNNGVNQMLFKLKPDNLGEMSVRLIEINGEMAAKIIVTSEATRKALQSNIHQLKNLFSPHQVVIERQEEITTQQIQKEQDQFDDQDEGDEQSSFHKQNNQEKEQDSNDHQESFHEILTEKV